MKIIVNKVPQLNEVEVVINCSEENATVQRILSRLNTLDMTLQGTFQNETFQIGISDILYIESVDRKTFLYTENKVYETSKRLYELDTLFSDKSFFRVSKSAMINLERVRSLRPELGARLILTMDNGERIVVSRQYAKNIKNALGVI